MIKVEGRTILKQRGLDQKTHPIMEHKKSERNTRFHCSRGKSFWVAASPEEIFSN